MDLEEWEYLSEDGFIDQLHQQTRKGKRVIPNPSLQPNSLINNEYLENFIDPHNNTKNDSKGVSLSPNLVIHVPVEFDLHIKSPSIPIQAFASEPETESVSSQVFFKKLSGNEFADMKLDSPKSKNMGLVPQIDMGKAQFEEKDENYKESDEKESENEGNHGGLDIWKMSMTGIGALCSFGFACATIFVIAIGTRRRGSKNQVQKLCLHVYNDEKQVVQHTNRMNEAISTLKGIPLNRGHISIGGFFEGV